MFACRQMQRFPVYIGGDLSHIDQYLVKLVTTNPKDLQLSGNVTLTAPESQNRRSLVPKTKAQRKAEREEALRKSQSEAGLPPSIHDRWRVTDPACPKKFSGAEEKVTEGQDTYMVMIYDKQTNTFQMVDPTFLHLTPDAPVARFKTLEEVEAYEKNQLKRASKAEEIADDADPAFDLKAALKMGRAGVRGGVREETGGKAKGKGRVKEEWEWRKVDDDEAMADDNDIDDLEQEEEAMEEFKRPAKSEETKRMTKLLRQRQAEGEEEEEEEEEEMGGLAENKEEEDEDDDESEEEEAPAVSAIRTNVALSGSREDRTKRARMEDVDVELIEAKKARGPISAQRPTRRDPATLTVDDVMQVFVRAANGGNCYDVKMMGPEIVSNMLGSTKGYSEDEKRRVLALICQCCAPLPGESKVFMLKRSQ